MEQIPDFSPSQLSLDRGGASALLMLRGNFELGDLGTASDFKIIGSGNDISAERGPWDHLIPLSFLKRRKLGHSLSHLWVPSLCPDPGKLQF